MSIWNNCPLANCQAEWLKWSENTTQEQQDQDYKDGNYGLQHCEEKGCHNIYFRGKNGGECESCSKQCCEDCTMGYESDEDDDSIHYCSGCSKN